MATFANKSAFEARSWRFVFGMLVLGIGIIPQATVGQTIGDLNANLDMNISARTDHNWGGYVVAASPGLVTDVKGSWIVPTVTCSGTASTYSVVWVGMDGKSVSGQPSNQTVEQIGTASNCLNGIAKYSAWYQFFPGPRVPITSLPINEGDQILAEVTFNTGVMQFTVQLVDETTGGNTGTIPLMTPPNVSAQRSTADWVLEDPTRGRSTLPLANFRTVVFGQDNTPLVTGTCYATIGTDTEPIGKFTTWPVFSLTMTTPGGVPEAVPSALSSDGSSFSITQPPPANLIVNGGFENFVVGLNDLDFGTFIRFLSPPPNTDIMAWTITGSSGGYPNNVDLVHSSLYPPFEGIQSLDMEGAAGASGVITQSFATTPGEIYNLSFEYGNNPYGTSASMNVLVTGSGTLLNQNVNHNTSTFANMDYQLFSQTFTANSATTTLQFSALTNSGFGIALDAVSVTPVGQPAIQFNGMASPKPRH